LNDREKIAMAELVNSQGETLQREIGEKIGITQSVCSRMIRRAQQKLAKECGYTM
jgi:DNA-directed RNA polymerase specialized sigma subunit